jgi:hypothetical protein
MTVSGSLTTDPELVKEEHMPGLRPGGAYYYKGCLTSGN